MSKTHSIRQTILQVYSCLVLFVSDPRLTIKISVHIAKITANATMAISKTLVRDRGARGPYRAAELDDDGAAKKHDCEGFQSPEPLWFSYCGPRFDGSRFQSRLVGVRAGKCRFECADGIQSI
jgi:hypothetical protein